MKKLVNVVGAVIVREGKALAAKRGQAMSLPDLWEFPGGKIELGESPREALVRELREELQCTVEIGAQVETTSFDYDFGKVILTTFYATITAGEPMITEHAEVRWCTAPELALLEWAPADLPAVMRVVADLNAASPPHSPQSRSDLDP